MIRVQVGETSDKVGLFAEHGSHRVVLARGEPAMKLARILVAAGFDPAEPCETARGDKVAMRYKSLGHAAGLTVVERDDGKSVPRLAEWRSFVIGAGKDALDGDG